MGAGCSTPLRLGKKKRPVELLLPTRTCLIDSQKPRPLLDLIGQAREHK